MKETSKQELKLLGHLYRELYSFDLVLVVLALLSSAVSDLLAEEFLSHVRQEEEGLDE